MDEYTQALSMGIHTSATFVFAALLLSFILTSVIGFTYRRTVQGLSYSRSYVQTQMLAGIVTAILIIAIGDNLARGLGILGTLAIVRFRTPIRDPRDIIFLFASITMGIACGAGVFSVAIIGTAFFCTAALYLHLAPFASRREHEGLLRFVLPRSPGEPPDLTRLLDAYCISIDLVAMREAAQGDLMEFAYQIRLRSPSLRADLLEALHQVAGIQEVSLLMQRSTVEI